MKDHLKPDSSFAAKVFPSPNHGERKQGAGLQGAGLQGAGLQVEGLRVHAPDMLILHYTGMAIEGEALQWLCNPISQVSCHYFVFENGHIVQLVPENRRAWHAGAACWAGERDINSASIGIEIANAGHAGGMPPFGSRQLDATLELCKDIVARLGIPAERVLAHSDVAPGRKQDPGELFPWRRFAEGGVGIFVEPVPLRDGRFFSPGDEGQPVSALQSMLAMFGYDIAITGVYDVRTEDVITAFQRHWRVSRVDGIADASTITTLRDLLAEKPVLPIG